jgi:hypothetical protein
MFILASIAAIYLTGRSHLPSKSFKPTDFVGDGSVIKGTLLGEQNAFSYVSRFPTK